MNDSDDEYDRRNSPRTRGGELNKEARDKLLINENRSFINRGFHDGYDEGRKTTQKKAFDSGYKKAFEDNFILLTLKGVAHALKSSYNLNNSNNNSNNISRSNIRSTSAASPSPSTTSTSSSSTAKTSSSSTSARNKSHSNLFNTCNNRNRRSHGSSSGVDGGDATGIGSTSALSTFDTTSCSSGSSINVANIARARGDVGSPSPSISSNHLSLLESMDFSNADAIGTIKNDLIKICRENRMEILAHYVSQIG